MNVWNHLSVLCAAIALSFAVCTMNPLVPFWPMVTMSFTVTTMVLSLASELVLAYFKN